MFGYVISNKRELKVREAELYRAYYCGVCKSVARKYGNIPRFALSYDMAFLSVLLASLIDKTEIVKREVCIANPIKKKPIVIDEAVDYAADIMMLLAWKKVEDDIEDENSFLGKIIKFFYRRKYNRLIRNAENLEKLEKQISKSLNTLRKLENEKSGNLDLLADNFGKIMEMIMLFGCEQLKIIDDNEKSNIIEPIKEIGYHIGRWIYIVDAFDDIKDDYEKNRFNPLIERFSEKLFLEKSPYDKIDYNSNLDKIDEFKNSIAAYVDNILSLSLNRLSMAFELLPIKKNKGILDNIIYVGLVNNMDIIILNKL